MSYQRWRREFAVAWGWIGYTAVDSLPAVWSAFGRGVGREVRR